MIYLVFGFLFLNWCSLPVIFLIFFLRLTKMVNGSFPYQIMVRSHWLSHIFLASWRSGWSLSEKKKSCKYIIFIYITVIWFFFPHQFGEQPLQQQLTEQVLCAPVGPMKYRRTAFRHQATEQVTCAQHGLGSASSLEWQVPNRSLARHYFYTFNKNLCFTCLSISWKRYSAFFFFLPSPLLMYLSTFVEKALH